MDRFYFRSAVVSVLIALSGCAALDAVDIENATHRGLIKIGTLEYVTHDGQLDREHAARVHGYAVEILDHLADGETTTIDQLERYISAQVPWDELPPGRVIAAQEFIHYLARYIRSKVPDDSERIVVARDVVALVADTLEPYQ